MSILTQLKQKFDTFLSNTFNQSDDYCLILISKLLEELDLELAATRDKSLEIVKIVPRTILTSKGLITFRRRYYYDTNNDTYLLYLTPKVGLTEIVKHILIDLMIVVYSYKATILLILL